MAVLALCLLWALTTAVQPAPVAPLGGPEPAQHEELTLLFHGALQLGQALNGVYRATEARLTEAGRSLGLFDRALGLLGTEVEEDVLHLQAEATALSLGEVARAQQALWDTVRRLQVQLRGAWLGQAHQEFETLKARADKQSHVLWALTGHIQRQQREMAEQQQWLRQIQERLHTAALPA
ncbi:angiopoietin-like protein 8 isoform X2 [Peromyscus eremicus]|uniref:angiopoietin-like protein 8 isoform X2 n=1 Tax=Peromyscus eremicus TaxID=42410 RepID=UPI0027DD3293|nr:angiopoietin-like protein 8 isoform X2 [Peromyscus eremicus]